jgi:hypothetical protein
VKQLPETYCQYLIGHLGKLASRDGAADLPSLPPRRCR